LSLFDVFVYLFNLNFNAFGFDLKLGYIIGFSFLCSLFAFMYKGGK